jgi:hypothetical protein
LEIDELYVGVDSRGAHYVFPVEAEGRSDFLSVVQIWQNFKMCAKRFRHLMARPVAAQFMADDAPMRGGRSDQEHDRRVDARF